MRIYEELFIVKPDAPDEEVDGFVEQLRGQLTTAGATLDKVEKWGKRGWPTRWTSTAKASYVLFQFSSEADVVKELERRLRVSDVVLKFLTVRIDPTLKRLEKRKKQRDKRAAKRRRESARSRRAHAGSGSRVAGRAGAGHARLAEGGLSDGGNKRKTRQRRAAAHRRRQGGRHARRNSISGARRYAASAWKRSTTSTTRT